MCREFLSGVAVAARAPEAFFFLSLAAMAHCSEAERVLVVGYLEDIYPKVYDKMLEAVRHDLLERLSLRGRREPVCLEGFPHSFKVQLSRVHPFRPGSLIQDFLQNDYRVFRRIRASSRFLATVTLSARTGLIWLQIQHRLGNQDRVCWVSFFLVASTAI